MSVLNVSSTRVPHWTTKKQKRSCCFKSYVLGKHDDIFDWFFDLFVVTTLALLGEGRDWTVMEDKQKIKDACCFERDLQISNQMFGSSCMDQTSVSECKRKCRISCCWCLNVANSKLRIRSCEFEVLSGWRSSAQDGEHLLVSALNVRVPNLQYQSTNHSSEHFTDQQLF